MLENIFTLKIFHWIDKSIIESIINNCETREYDNWEIIVMESEESNGEWYIIKSWRVNISIAWIHIAELWSGDIFGEIALLNEEQRTATVCAETSIEVFVLTLEDIIKMMSADDKINKTIIKRIEQNLERN
jgi:CRP-like cAMP-binding protein